MIADDLTWPDTRDVEPPSDHLYRSATWLLGRHPQLAELVERVPGVLDEEDGLFLDLDALANALVGLDTWHTAWAAYVRAHPAPAEDRYDAFEEAGPQRTEQTRAVGAMSRTEQTRLRLLATFATGRVPFRASDLQGLDDNGQRLLVDWCAALVKA